jgi:hypothetical protein
VVISLHDSQRFRGDETNGGNIGGQEGFDSAVTNGYKVDFIVKLRKINATN